MKKIKRGGRVPELIHQSSFYLFVFKTILRVVVFRLKPYKTVKRLLRYFVDIREGEYYASSLHR
jgi:hypothetical protein